MQPHTAPAIVALLLSLTTAAITSALPRPINTLTSLEAYVNIPHSQPALTPHPSTHRKRSFGRRIRGLPAGYTGTFVTLISLSPQSPSAATFIRFFRAAAALSATDRSPGRRRQRFRCGELVLELLVKGRDEIVSREFVEATTLWLADAAVKGWTGLFRAYVQDESDGQVVEVRMGTVWDYPSDD